MKNKNRSSKTDAADRLLFRPVFGIPFFFAVLTLLFFLSYHGIGGVASRLLEALFLRWRGAFSHTLRRLGVSAFAIRYLDGIYSSIASAIAFLPQTAVFFLLVRALDDCGYLSRAVFVTDRFFRIFGLSGKAVIPILLGYGCGACAVAVGSSEPAEGRVVIRALPFVPCSARLPVILFLADSFFPHHKALVAVLIFALSFVLVFLSCLLCRDEKKQAPSLIAELPDYRLPRARILLNEIVKTSREYLFRAGTAVFLSCAIFSALAMLTRDLHPTEHLQSSLLYAVFQPFSFLFRPLGFGSPEMTAALFFGFFAKENIIAVLELMQCGDAAMLLSVPAAVSFTVFSAFYTPCIFQLIAEEKRVGGAKALSFCLRTFVIAYAVSMLFCTALRIFLALC